MTDKLAGPDIAGQTSNACILSELSNVNVPSINHQHNRLRLHQRKRF